MNRAHVELNGVSKRYGGTQALTDIDLVVRRATIHGLVGENGAGKSTLGRILAGAVQPDRGEILLDGKPVHLRSPREAYRHGVAMIAQELMIVPQLSVVENVYLGVERRRSRILDRRGMTRRFRELSQAAGFVLAPDVLAGTLRVADQQKVEILRVLVRNAELIVMDEPTAALSAVEAEKLFDVVRALREQGKTIVYVSHFLEEVLALADDVTVLKDGALVRTSTAASETPATLVQAMLGRSFDLTFPERAPAPDDAPPVIEVRHVSRGPQVRDVSLTVRAGEIVGVAGLVGSGRTELARALFGADPVDNGEVVLEGEPLRVRSPRGAIRRGVAMIPESRKAQGLILQHSVAENLSLPHLDAVSRAGFVRLGARRKRVAELVASLGIKAGSEDDPVAALSGGNQQKVLFGRWLFTAPRLLIADEPTRGVDVGAKRAIYELIVELARSGMGVLVISSELEEVLGLAHRVLVMRGGKVVREFPWQQATPERVIAAAFGAAQ